jgi:hypothetical protein
MFPIVFEAMDCERRKSWMLTAPSEALKTEYLHARKPAR